MFKILNTYSMISKIKNILQILRNNIWGPAREARRSSWTVWAWLSPQKLNNAKRQLGSAHQSDNCLQKWRTGCYLNWGFHDAFYGWFHLQKSMPVHFAVLVTHARRGSMHLACCSAPLAVPSTPPTYCCDLIDQTAHPKRATGKTKLKLDREVGGGYFSELRNCIQLINKLDEVLIRLICLYLIWLIWFDLTCKMLCKMLSCEMRIETYFEIYT